MANIKQVPFQQILSAATVDAELFIWDMQLTFANINLHIRLYIPDIQSPSFSAKKRPRKGFLVVVHKFSSFPVNI